MPLRGRHVDRITHLTNIPISFTSVDGILSSEPKDNPYLWNANHIYIPYCSSDSWTGQLDAGMANSSQRSASFSFLGSKILEQVIESLYEDLPRDYSLYDARSILLAGDSAGATGVILNLDRVNEFIENKANLLRTNCARNINIKTGSNNNNNNFDPSLEVKHTNCQQKLNTQPVPIVRGLADSGWFLDNEPYLESTYLSDFELNNGNCDQTRCTPLQSIKQAMRYWNGQVPDACYDRYPLEPWRCYFGYRAYQTLKTPLFVVQWLYDEAQLMVDHISRPDTSGQWNYVNKVSDEMRASLENVTALFAPSCFSHSLVIKRSWNEITINGFKLPHILNTWEEQALLDMSSAIPNTSDNLRISLVLPEDRSSLSSSLQLQDSSSTLFVAEQQQQQQPSSAFETTSQMVEGKNPPQQQLEKVSLQRANTISPISFREIQGTTIGIREYPLPIVQQQSQSSKSMVSLGNNNATKTGRSRKRKRNNSNQQQQHRSRQIRQKNTLSLESFPQDSGHLQAKEFQYQDNPRGSSILSANPLQDLLIPLLDRSQTSERYLGGLNRNASGINLSGGGRSGRSTLLSTPLLDDATLMLSNNVPDDNLASGQPQTSTTFSLNENRSDPKKWSSWISSEPSLSNVSPASPLDLSIQQTTSRSSDDRFRLIDSCTWPQCNRDCPALELDYGSPVNIQF